MEATTTSATQLQEEARRFAARLTPRDDDATIVALSGDLGAGKTTFAQGVAAALGVQESVTSPTFVIEKIYILNPQSLDVAWDENVPQATFSRLIHIDAYRLNEAHELEVLGWREIVADPGNLILIEWPEKVSELIPDDAIRIRFDIDDEKRIISINGG